MEGWKGGGDRGVVEGWRGSGGVDWCRVECALRDVRCHEQLHSWCALPIRFRQQLAEASALTASVRAKQIFC